MGPLPVIELSRWTKMKYLRWWKNEGGCSHVYEVWVLFDFYLTQLRMSDDKWYMNN